MHKLKSPPKVRALPLATTVAALALLCASGCAVYEEPQASSRDYRPVQSGGYPYAEPNVVSVYVEPPLYEPPPIAVPWAPPPLLRELPPPMPFGGAVWVGGYWVWQGNWVWATGRWAPRPRPDYAWVQPYYEHRDGVVIFITGHWSPPGVAFVPPPRGMRFNVVAPSPGARRGYAPMGPPGVFSPPPPGSRPGVIVPAPSRRFEPRPVLAAPPTPPVQDAPTPNRDRYQERGRVPDQRRSEQRAPVQVAPAPGAPEPTMQTEQSRQRRRDGQVRMDAPSGRGDGDVAPPAQREERRRGRGTGQKDDRDKRDSRGE